MGGEFFTDDDGKATGKIGAVGKTGDQKSKERRGKGGSLGFNLAPSGAQGKAVCLGKHGFFRQSPKNGDHEHGGA